MDNEKNVLPPDFNGIFMFTNPTDEDFTAMWDKVAYTYPARKTSPMIIQRATPEEIQNIRKKFAKELAIREYYKTDSFKVLGKENSPVASVRSGATYTDSALAPFIQQCLDPLPQAQAITTPVKGVKVEDMMHRDEDGEPITQVLDRKTKKSLKAGGTSYEG